MDLNNRKNKHGNIFNKDIIHPYYDKILDGIITEDEIKELNGLTSIVKVRNNDELMTIVDFYSKNYPKDSLNWLDVSRITEMTKLFQYTDYTGDISKWDVSMVENMSRMFMHSKFDNDISQWDVSNVKNMSQMFFHSIFNQDISQWDVSNVTDMEAMFNISFFDKDIS